MRRSSRPLSHIRAAGFLILAALSFLHSLHGDVVITEFMADNKRTLDDEDGDSPDWIEIYNPAETAVALEGFALANDPSLAARWRFPAASLAPNGFLVVFASGKDRADPASELHTDFKLPAGEGGFLALLSPAGDVLSAFDGATVAHFEDISYGVEQSGAVQESVLLASAASCRLHVPASDLGNGWLSPEFDDSSWTRAVTGVGYERGSGYEALIGSGADVEEQMFETNGSVYVRIPFDVAGAGGFASLTLEMKYDDGFAAFLNGVRAADANAPGTLRWNSTATGNHDDSAATTFEEFDMTPSASQLAPGRNILAIQGLNTNLTSSDLLVLPEIHATKLTATRIGPPGYLRKPTPGAFNGATFDGFVRDTAFSVDRGIYREPFRVEITTRTEGASIRYTTDGSEPTATHGVLYGEPVLVTVTTVLRAAAFKDRIQALPTWSIVTPLENLFDPSQGIYVNPGNDGRNWERPASFELIHPDPAEKGFQIDGGLRIRGGFSRSTGNPKHAFRLFFRSEYGDANLDYPLFGDEGASQFDKLDLRTTQNYSWAFQRDARNTFLRDVFSRDLQGKLGHPYTRSRYYHTYINGVYWGVYQSQERSEAAFAATYFGGNEEDYDVVTKFGGTVDGNRDAYSTRRSSAKPPAGAG